MTDNDIIKALERMAFIESRKGEVQKQKVLESAAEIINRQKAEIYKLEGSLIEEITRRENWEHNSLCGECFKGKSNRKINRCL